MKTVMLCEIGNDGHREAYMRYFISALLHLGHKVICLIPDPKPIMEWVEATHPDAGERVIYRTLDYRRNRFPHSGRWQERLNILYNWYDLGKQVRQFEKKPGCHIDLVFLNFLDSYLINYTPTGLIDRLVGKPWSGIYFFPAFLRIQPELLKHPPRLNSRDYILTAKKCLALCSRDEGLQDAYTSRLGGKKVLVFPEIADLAPPDLTDPLRQRILEHACGRLIIGNIGLEKHKGNFELMRLAKTAEPHRFYFVFSGRDDNTLFDFLDQDQARELRDFIEHLPENCGWYPGILSEGANFNAILSTFDIVYAIYTNFYGASNRLTKAAYFRKLVLADDKYCIGDLMRKYQLGEAIPDTSPGTMLAALHRLETRIRNQEYPEAGWNTYLAKNNQQDLEYRFAELIDLL